MNLVIICPHTKLLQYYWSDSLCYLYMRPPWLIYFITKDTFHLKNISLICFSSVQFSCSVVSDSLRLHESQHARLPCLSPTPRVYPNSCLLSQWCHPAISSSVVPFSSSPQSLPASESLPMSQLFARGGQSTGVSVSIILSKEIPGLISFRMDWLNILAVQGIPRSLFQ